jgi:hypothetical protein
MSGSGQIYRIPLVRTAVSTPVDLADILTTAAQILWVHEIDLGQSTEVGDAQEEMLQLAWRVGNTTPGTGGNSGVVANPQMPGQPVSGLTIGTFRTTKATGGTVITNPIWDWPLRMRFEKIFTPDIQLFLPPSTRGCLELVAAPADPVTMSGTITVEIVG